MTSGSRTCFGCQFYNTISSFIIIIRTFKLEAFQRTALAASLTCDTLNSLLFLFQMQTVIVYGNSIVQLDSLVLSINFGLKFQRKLHQGF